MLDLPDYAICEQIHENSRIKVYKGYTSHDRRPVIIKALKNEAANPIRISRLIHEYEITRNLNIEGIVKPMRLEQAGPIFALVMEDVGAVSLRKYIQDCPVDLPAFLNIAVQLVGALGRLHQKGIIHRDLKPENILIHPNTRQVYIIDFSSAVFFSAESKNALLPNTPVGTLEYMSPEQTGRFNIGIDQRSDLYSLGVIFYEIMTGRLPLQAENPAEWIYALITQKPQPPDQINSDIIPVISEIIMKLLAKAAEERYQSAYGLLWDLQECEKRLIQTDGIEFFPIGRSDAFTCFRLPRKLYGREKEKEALKAAFERLCDGQSGTIMVSGYPGIGKTMLINESIRPIALEKGWFIMGKCDQLGQNIPYAPFAAAFGKLIKQLMTESREELNRWKKRILRVLGRNGAVVAEIIPELECIIGKQSPVDALSPKEAANRFLMVFSDFVRVFARKKHPLALFLDDLQWADVACVRLLKYLTRDANLSSLLFIGAFRDNEVNGDHPLMEMLEETDQEPDKKHISLMPLKWEQVTKLVADTLHIKSNNAAALSGVLYLKSGGNPFFLRQLLLMIHDEGLLYFDTQEGCWKWELEAIQKLELGEDVLELLLKKLQSLPEETCEVMKQAACIGNRFELETLAAVCGKSLEETAACLMPSVLEGLVLTTANQEENLPATYPEMESAVFEFLHDRVQQAVYSLIMEDEKKEKHFAIGRVLLQNTICSSLEENILSIMDHFNRSLELIYDPAERMELAGYNLLAGRKAKASAAYASAMQYFRCGKTLLSDTAWEQAYQLSFDLHLELAQAEFLSGNEKDAEELFDNVIEQARTELERAGVYGLKVILYAGVGKYTEAVHTGIHALKNFGVKLPIHPTRLDYARELLLYKWYMRNKKIEVLTNLPEIRDPVKMKIAELMTCMTFVTMTSYPDLFSFIILKTGNYAVRNGNTEMTSVGYLGYSLTAGIILGDYKAGDSYGRVCIHLAEKYGRSSSKCIIYFVVGAFISHWTMHASFGLEYLKKAVLSGVEAGEILIMGYAHCLLLEIRYLIGVSLEKIAEEIRKKNEIARRLNHDNLANNVVIYGKAVSVLQGKTAESLASGAAEFQEDEFLTLVKNDQASQAAFYFCKMQLCYMAGNYKEALSAAKKIEPLTGSILGFLISAEYNFYYSLAIAALYGERSFKDRKRRWKTLMKNQRQMKKWSEACRENFEHKYLLVAAETARLRNRREEAMSLYDRAIQSARGNGYLQNEALANELAANYYLFLGLRKIARTYMLDACRGYNRWGAFAKVKELQNRYPELLDKIDFEKQKHDTAEVFEKTLSIAAQSDSEPVSGPDMYFIDKAVENISKETDINKLIENFLDIVVQSIGADKGYLILEKSGELFIEAIKSSNFNGTVVNTVPLEECPHLSKAVVRYVARTLETVVLNNGEQSGIFTGDPYIAASNSKSIVCLPLMFQGIPLGILYFENSLISGVFTPDRLKALRILSTQLAYVKKLQSYLNENTGKNRGGIYPYFIDPLTARETEVIKLIAAGHSNKEIAERLEMTVNTVKTHVKNIYEKLKVNRRVQVVERAKELDIL